MIMRPNYQVIPRTTCGGASVETVNKATLHSEQWASHTYEQAVNITLHILRTMSDLFILPTTTYRSRLYPPQRIPT